MSGRFHPTLPCLALLGLLLAGLPACAFLYRASPDMQVAERDGEIRVPVLKLPWHFGGPLWIIVGVEGRPDKVLLFRTTWNELVAVRDTCPHDGCDLGLLQEVGEVLCPCDDSHFGPDGAVLQGPATAPLHLYPVRQQGPDVVITLDD